MLFSLVTRGKRLMSNNALQATAGVPARLFDFFTLNPLVALRHRRHRLCLSLVR